MSWISLALLSALAVSTLSLPQPDSGYNIPAVGTGRRAQYYVLHDDGTFKYGYDTGEGAYEAAKQKTRSHQHGKFGYRDPDGNHIRVEYQAGEEGFQPSGTHLPAAHPDFYAAHAEASARPPFNDPLADADTDASYGFQFADAGLSRSEQSDPDGNVRGSYAYTDEEGRTRSYTYTAGQGVGFVVEGSDLPEAPLAPGDTPASTRLSSSAGASAAAAASSTFRAGTSHTSTSYGSSSPSAGSRTGFRRPAVSHTGVSRGTSSIFRSVGTSAAAALRTPAVTQPRYTSFVSTGQYTGELANTRTSLNPDGSRSFAYETSSHSRDEAEDADDNVVGKFEFVAPDDGQRRAIQYEASSDTGFIAEGAHIPVGPVVPGAQSGQPTGRIEPVQEVPFIDPLADTGIDASYNFGFDSEQYSRLETADADGNVQGTYTVVDDDGTRRTYRFRAGKGVGFETEEVSTSQGPRPTRPASVSATSPFSTTGTTSRHSSVSARPIISYKSPSSGSFTSSQRFSHTTSPVKTTTTTRTSPVRTTPLRSSITHTASQAAREIFPGFNLRQYDASEDRGKYGYVLTFDR